MSVPPKKPIGLSTGLSGLSGLGGKDKKKEDDKAPKKLSLPKSTIVPSKGVDSNGMGKELLVKDAAGIVMDSIFQMLLKLPSGALSDSRTFRLINNSGTRHMIDSTLGMRLSDKEGWTKFSKIIKDINIMLDKIGDNNANQYRIKEKKKNGVIDMKTQEMKEGQEKVEGEDEKGEKCELEIVHNDGKKEKELNMKENNRILFIKDFYNQSDYLTGYEVYAGDSKNIGMKGNPELWKKWDDENIIELIKKGAKVTWIGPKDGPLANVRITWAPENVEFLEHLVTENMFSFHQVYVPKDINVLNKIKKIGEYLQDAIDRRVDLNSLLQKSKKDQKKPIIEDPDDDGVELTSTDPRYELRDLFPVNPRGRYVDTTILEDPQLMSIDQIGTGMSVLMKDGGFKEKYLGIEPVETIMNKVIGERNYTLLVGSVSLIEMQENINLEGEELEFDGNYTGKGQIIKADPVHYSIKKSKDNGCFELVRGIYIDQLGNFKICQIVVDVMIGDKESRSNQIATAKQLAARSLLTTTFPLFASVPEKDAEKLQRRIDDERALNDFLERRNILIKAFAEIEQSREASFELLSRKRIKGNEMNLIMEGDEKEYQPKRTLDIKYDQPKMMYEGESKRQQERINQMVEEDMRNTRETYLKEFEEQKRMEEERKEGEN